MSNVKWNREWLVKENDPKTETMAVILKRKVQRRKSFKNFTNSRDLSRTTQKHEKGLVAFSLHLL